MKFAHPSVDPDREFTVMGNLAYDDDTVLILDNDYVIDHFQRQYVVQADLEHRPSFSNPLIGGILAIVFVLGGPIGVLTGNLPLMVAGVFMLMMGVYLLKEIAGSRQVPWLIVQMEKEKRKYPLKLEEDEALQTFVSQLNTAKHKAD